MKFIKVFNNVFDKEFCDGVIKIIDTSIDYGLSRKRFNPIVVDHQTELNSFLLSPELTSENDLVSINSCFHSQIFLEKINYLIIEYFKGLQIEMPGTIVPPVPLNMLGQKSSASDSSGYHSWHCETSNLQVSHRALAYTLYLNDVPEGEGETEYLHQGYRHQPKMGDVVIWPAAFTHIHRGNPVYSVDKYIVTGWAHHQMP